LDVWKKGIEIVKAVYEVALLFPKEEKYGLASQMKRSAVSIPSNVAEGFNRQYNNEYRQFLFIASGSCAELETQCEIACELGLMKNETVAALVSTLQHESRMITKLIQCLK
jgi:four helix bundle protein